MRTIRSITILSIITLCVGCGGEPEIRRLTSSSSVVAFGDSLTFGTGVSPGDSYPSRLSGLLGCDVVNAGVAGEDTSEGLRRLPGVLEQEQPDLVILCHGGNDMLRKLKLELTRANLRAMVSMIREQGADVVLIGVPKPGLRLKTPALYREIAEEQGIPLETKSVPEILSTRSLKSDPVHPNADGYQQLAESVAALITESEAP